MGYEPDRLRSAGFVHIELEDFDHDQISGFLAKWYGATEADPGERVRLEHKLLQAIQETRAVRGLAVNPLLLTVMAVLNVDQDLPRDRVHLYTQMIRLMLHDWDASRSLGDGVLAWQEKADFLCLLAGIMQLSVGLSKNLIDRAQLVQLCREYLSGLGVGDQYGKAAELIRELTERNCILSYAGANRFSFVHRTFLEYFTASGIAKQFETTRNLTFQQLQDEVFGLHWKDESWHEVLLLTAAMIDEASVAKIIQFLMGRDGSDSNEANLMLAAGCLGEVGNRAALHGIDESLWELFVSKAVRYDAPLGRPRMKPYQLEPLRDQAARLIASVWGATKGHSWLKTAAASDPDPQLRTAAMEVLVQQWKDSSETLGIVKSLANSDPELLTQNAAIRALARGWKEDPEVLPLIRHLASIDRCTFIQRTAVQELARGWREDPATFHLLDALAKRTSNGYVRAVALEELARGWKDDPDIYSRLISVLGSDPDSYVRRFAIYAVTENWKGRSEIVPVFVHLAHSDPAEDVRGAAAGALIDCWKTNAESLRLTREFIFSDADERVRALMVQELARRWRDEPDTLPTVKGLIRSDISKLVRMSAAYELVRCWTNNVF